MRSGEFDGGERDDYSRKIQRASGDCSGLLSEFSAGTGLPVAVSGT
jgi:hypothetical protein